MQYFLIVLTAFLLFAAFLVVRGLLFKPNVKKNTETSMSELDFSRAEACFSELIKCKTVSKYNGIDEDEAEFEKLINSLPSLFPNVYARLEHEKVGRRGLLYRWQGESSKRASVLMAHFDVVEAIESQWTFEPFSGEIVDGILRGRGTLDTKGTFCAVLSVVDFLLSKGYTPKEDIYLAFSGEEEIHGNSAKDIAELLNSRNVDISMVLDEGGAVVEHIFASTGRIAVIGIAEKGVMDLELSISGEGGHASHPPARGMVGKLATAISNIEKHPMKAVINPAFSDLIKTVGRDAGFAQRVIFANLWLFSPLLSFIAKKKGGELNAMIRTSFAFTWLVGSRGMNVMPSRVAAGINIRCLNENDDKEILSHIKRASREKDLKLNVLHFEPACKYSKTEGEAWEKLKGTIEQTWGDAVVAPYLMIAASDSRHYSSFSDKVYRFSAMEMTKQERKMIHGNDESIRLCEWHKTLDFYCKLIKQL